MSTTLTANQRKTTTTQPSATPPKRTSAFIWKKHGLALLAPIVVVATLESVFAIAGVGEDEYLRPDAITGSSGIPNKAVTHRKEGFGRFRYNSFGMQDNERSLSKPANTRRIAFLGDSFVEALQVDRKENFCSLVEKKLNDSTRTQNSAGTSIPNSASAHFEVLNFGVSSSNLAQIYLRLKHKVFAFHPDIVLVGVRVDASLQLAPNPSGGFVFARPNFFPDGKGGLIQDNTVQQLWQRSPEGRRMRATEWLREHSRIWGVISVGAEQLLGWLQKAREGKVHWGADVIDKQTAFAPNVPTAAISAPSTAPAAVKGKTSGPGAGLPAAVQAQIAYNTRFYDKSTSSLWPTADALIRYMKDECDRHGSKLVLVRFSAANNWKNYLETKLLTATAHRYNIPLLDTAPTFDKAFSERPAELFYDGHFTPLSHRIFADDLFRYMHEIGLDR